MSGSSARGVSQAFERAVMLHQSGQMAEAERAYRQIINTKPNHTEALHLLGILRFQQGHADESLEWIARSLKVAPRHAEALYDRGNILAQLARYEEAIASYAPGTRRRSCSGPQFDDWEGVLAVVAAELARMCAMSPPP
jgi:tetratricopeptide (TPR) repeat protein